MYFSIIYNKKTCTKVVEASSPQYLSEIIIVIMPLYSLLLCEHIEEFPIARYPGNNTVEIWGKVILLEKLSLNWPNIPLCQGLPTKNFSITFILTPNIHTCFIQPTKKNISLTLIYFLPQLFMQYPVGTKFGTLRIPLGAIIAQRVARCH